MAVVYLGLGSNLGVREKNIRQAVAELENRGVRVERMSSLIETDPVGGPPQGKFINAVVKGQTEIPPHALLQGIKSIERDLGRIPAGKDGPRSIDIDILLYGKITMDTPELTIPHPRMRQRDFVLIPLREIAPGWTPEDA